MNKCLFVIFILISIKSLAQPEINDTIKTNLLFDKAYQLEKASKLDSATILFKQLAIEYKKGKMWRRHITALNHLAYIYGEYLKHTNEALKYSNESVELCKQHLDNGDLLTAESYYFKGVVYLNMTYYPLQAIDCFSITEKIFRQNYSNKHPWIARLYSAYASAYSELNTSYSQQKSTEYLYQSIELCKELFGEESAEVGKKYLSLAAKQAEHFGNKTESKTNFIKAETILAKTLPPENFWIRACKGNRIFFSDTLNRSDANYIIENIDIDANGGNYNYATMAGKLVDWYLMNNQLDSARYWFRKTLRKTGVSTDFAISVKELKHNMDIALYYRLFSTQLLLLANEYQQERKESIALALFYTSAQFDSIVAIHRYHQAFSNNNMAHSTTNKKIKNRILATCYQIINDQTVSEQLKQQAKDVAVQTSDNFKALSMRENIETTDYLLNSGFNSDTVRKYFALKKDIETTNRKLLLNNTENDLLMLSGQLSELRNEYIGIRKHFFDKNPKIFFEPYKNNCITTVHDIQKKIDDKHTAVVGYYSTKRELYIIAITQDNFNIDKISTGNDINKHLSLFRNSLVYGYINPDIEKYKTAANKLRQYIFPKLPKYIKNVIIIPDANLGIIPFEALIKKVNTRTKLYSELSYLAHDFSFSYHYSFAQYANSHTDTTKYDYNFIAFAPVFDSENNVELLSENTLRSIETAEKINNTKILNHEGIIPLPNTYTEISEIRNLFKTKGLKNKLMIRNEATELEFNNHLCYKTRFLHIATHGFSNGELPELSGLLFTKEIVQSISDNEGIVYSGEIENYSINTDLLVLSACESGFGQINKSEGIIGLARSFMISGAKNILVSLWKISDKSTSELMISFYNNHLNNRGESYSMSLQKAKIKLIKQEKYAHPFFWAGFVLIGN